MSLHAAVEASCRRMPSDVWLPGGGRSELARAVVSGSRRDILTPRPQSGDPAAAARYHRQSLLFGLAGQAILASAKVAIIGAGGVGMLLVQLLARLGVGHLIVIDPERVDPTNLPRLPEATRLDAMDYLDRDGMPPLVRRAARRRAARKIRVARRIARRANPAICFEGVVGDVADDKVARRITDADFIFLAADTMLARTVVNQIAYQYLIPTLLVGSKPVIRRDTGDVLDVYAVVRTLGTAPGCLSCNGLINPARLSEESLADPRQVINQRYVDDPDVHAPSVITLNAMGAGWAANDFMQYITGLGRPCSGFRILRTNPVLQDAPHVTIQQAAVDPACYICGTAPRSVRGTGDNRELPTRSS
jgi:molybdopterin/thiamine biosynthesis adenylyltransferase